MREEPQRREEDEEPQEADPAETDEPKQPAPRRRGKATGQPARRRRIPPPEKRAREVGRRYMRTDGREAPLVVTITEGPVTDRYAPAELVMKLGERIVLLLKELTGGLTPMFYGAEPGSMTLVFGDPDLEAEGQLPVDLVAPHAERVAELIDLEGDELFARAQQIGPRVRPYNDLTQLVQSEGVTMHWLVRDGPIRVLSAERAARQHSRLSAPPKTQDRPIVVNGVLYRVITESTREGFEGSVGIHLHSWSSRPPRVRAGARIIAFYETSDVEQKIRAGLVGEPVQASLMIRQPVPGTSIDPERYDLILTHVESGQAEDPILGIRLLDETEAEGFE